MSNLRGYGAELLYTLTTAVTANTYTSQRVISAPNTQPRAIIPANYFASDSLGRALCVEGYGTIGATSGTNNFTAVLAWDPTPGTIGSTLVTMTNAVTVTASVSTAGFNFRAMITATNVSGSSLTLQTDAVWNMGAVTNGTVSTAPQTVYTSNSIASLNAEALAAIELLGTWSANNSANTTILKQLFVWGLN